MFNERSPVPCYMLKIEPQGKSQVNGGGLFVEKETGITVNLTEVDLS